MESSNMAHCATNAEERVDSGVETARDSSISPHRNTRSSGSFSPRSSGSENGHELHQTMARNTQAYETMASPGIKVNNDGKWKSMEKKEVSYIDYDAVLSIYDREKHRDFGFTLKGGREKREKVCIETLAKNGPADKAGIKIGDILLEIDGESVQDQFLTKINPSIRQAVICMADLELRLRRTNKIPAYAAPIANSAFETADENGLSPRSQASFEEKRSIFCRNDNLSPNYDSLKPRQIFYRNSNRYGRFGGSFYDKKTRLPDPEPINSNTQSINNNENKSNFEWMATSRPVTDHLMPRKDFLTDFGYNNNNYSNINNKNNIEKSEIDQPKSSSNIAAIYNDSKASMRQVNFNFHAPLLLPGVDYKVVSFESDKPVGKITDFLPEIERDESNDRRNVKLKRPTEDDECIIETNREKERQDVLASARVAPAGLSVDVAIIRKNFEEIIKKEQASLATAYYSPRLPFPRSKAQAAYVVSRALAPKIRGSSDISGTNTTVPEMFGKMKESDIDYSWAAYRRMDGIEADDQIKGVTSVRRYNSIDNLKKPSTKNRSDVRRKTGCVADFCPSNYDRIVNGLAKDNKENEYASAIRNVAAVNQCFNNSGAARPFRPAGQPSQITSPITPGKKISEMGTVAKNLSDKKIDCFPNDRVATWVHQNAALSRQVALCMAKKAAGATGVVSPQRKISDAEKEIESMEHLANKVLENSKLIDLIGKQQSTGPPAPKFPTTQPAKKETDCDDDCVANKRRLYFSAGENKTCSKCATKIGKNPAMSIEALEMLFHLSCFTCQSCNIALGDGMKGTDVRVMSKRLFCQICYERNFA